MWRNVSSSLSALLLVAAGAAACGGDEDAGSCVGVHTFSGSTYLVSEPVEKLPLAEEVGAGTIDESVCGRGEERRALRRIKGVDPALALGSSATDSSVELIWVSLDRVKSLDAVPPELDPYVG